LGSAYHSLGQYQQAIEFYQQSLAIKREIGDRRGEAKAWFNLGLALENVKRESDAVDAYRNARELYQAMGLDPDVQDCDKTIDRLSQPQVPIWRWLKRLWHERVFAKRR
jgi:tetratricopeptide (TPR) repeat protein